jgi:hypothetical protein
MVDRAPHGQRLAHLRIERRVLGVGLHAQAVERLGEEAAHRGGDHHLEDLAVVQAERAQPLHVRLGDRRGVGCDLVGQVHHGHVAVVEPGAAVVIEDRAQLAGFEVAVEQHRPVRQRAVAGAQPPRRRQRDQLVAARVHRRLDRAVQLQPGRVDLWAQRERALVVGRLRRAAVGLYEGQFALTS